jgi:hypothetical protein
MLGLVNKKDWVGVVGEEAGQLEGGGGMSRTWSIPRPILGWDHRDNRNKIYISPLIGRSCSCLQSETGAFWLIFRLVEGRGGGDWVISTLSSGAKCSLTLKSGTNFPSLSIYVGRWDMRQATCRMPCSPLLDPYILSGESREHK